MGFVDGVDDLQGVLAIHGPRENRLPSSVEGVGDYAVEKREHGIWLWRCG